jgi:threonine dehydrogenase-like Zn-dependent dehydrogenase
LHIHGSVGHTGGIFPYAIRLLAAGRIKLLPMITSRFGLDQAIEAVKTAEKLGDAKVMVRQ